MSADLNYSEIVKQAEAAVASIKDTELKGIAFGKILDTLLGQQHQGEGHMPAKPQKSGRKIEAAPARKRGGPKGYVEELVEDGFFKAPKTLAAIKAELSNRGHHMAMTALSGPMMTLCQERRLRRQKVRDGKKQIFTYSNW
jgi:DNA invertase Pin-like site-specific DNA recombinase